MEPETLPNEAAAKAIVPKAAKRRAKAAAKKTAKPKAKARPKAKKQSAKAGVRKGAKKVLKARAKARKTAKRKAKKPGTVERSERLDMRLTKAEKGKVLAKAAKLRRTVTSIVIEAIEKLR